MAVTGGRRITLREYAVTWIAERPGLRPRTVELYSGLVKRHIVPTLDGLTLADMSLPAVPRWRAGLLAAGVGAVTVAKSYRLPKAIPATAVEDGIIRRNPCRIPGASVENSAERPVATIPQILALADAIGARFRALVLRATFAGLRWGELMGLRRGHADLARRTIRIEVVVSEVNGQLMAGETKSFAGRRTVPFAPEMQRPGRDHGLDQGVRHVERVTGIEPA